MTASFTNTITASIIKTNTPHSFKKKSIKMLMLDYL